MWLAAAAGLGACAKADSQVKFLPDFVKDKAPTPAAADPQPDVKTLVRERRQEMFVGAIDGVLVGPPHRKGSHWMFCARPSGRGAGGQPLAAQTYLVEIDGTIIGDRLPVDGTHWCAREPYEPS
jgi:hypothetical protein